MGAALALSPRPKPKTRQPSTGASYAVCTPQCVGGWSRRGPFVIDICTDDDRPTELREGNLKGTHNICVQGKLTGGALQRVA